jgi:hypothetical protein
VTIVSNTDVGLWAVGEEWTFAEELRIGALEGSPDYQFGSVSHIAIDSEDRIFVLDGQAQHIQVYSPDGVYLQTVGGPGSGPGELRAGMALLMGPGDTLIVPDGQNLRFNRYAPDGSSAGSFRMVIEDGIPLGFKVSSSGVIAEQIRPMVRPDQPATEVRTDAIVLVTPDGVVTDTLITFPSGASFSPDRILIYAAEAAWDLTDSLELVIGWGDEYRIDFHSGGRLERIIAKPFERAPVGDRDKEVVWAYAERAWAQYGASEEQKQRLRNRIKFADVFPAFQEVAIGPEGTTWVQHVQPASELSEEDFESFDLFQDQGASVWDVFDSDGRFLGAVTFPKRFTPRVFRDDKIYGVWRDELDVQYMVRLRIVGDLGTGAT